LHSDTPTSAPNESISFTKESAIVSTAMQLQQTQQGMFITTPAKVIRPKLGQTHWWEVLNVFGIIRMTIFIVEFLRLPLIFSWIRYVLQLLCCQRPRAPRRRAEHSEQSDEWMPVNTLPTPVCLLLAGSIVASVSLLVTAYCLTVLFPPPPYTSSDTSAILRNRAVQATGVGYFDNISCSSILFLISLFLTTFTMGFLGASGVTGGNSCAATLSVTSLPPRLAHPLFIASSATTAFTVGVGLFLWYLSLAFSKWNLGHGIHPSYFRNQADPYVDVTNLLPPFIDLDADTHVVDNPHSLDGARVKVTKEVSSQFIKTAINMSLSSSSFMLVMASLLTLVLFAWYAVSRRLTMESVHTPDSSPHHGDSRVSPQR